MPATEYVPLDVLLRACDEADERDGNLSSTLVRLLASVHRMSAEAVAFGAWVGSHDQTAPEIRQ